jgi:uncharacterized protein YdeI (YjbR/CyaY-like superfamily)
MVALAKASVRPSLAGTARKNSSKASVKVRSAGTKLSAPAMAIPGGTVHKVPTDLRSALAANAEAVRLWHTLTPLARNEFICWCESAKLAETRARRIRRALEELEEGMRRPCCWPGCAHRERLGH